MYQKELCEKNRFRGYRVVKGAQKISMSGQHTLQVKGAWKANHIVCLSSACLKTGGFAEIRLKKQLYPVA